MLKAKASSKMELFDCDDVGKLQEDVGYKVNYNQEAETMKLTQPASYDSKLSRWI